MTEKFGGEKGERGTARDLVEAPCTGAKGEEELSFLRRKDYQLIEPSQLLKPLSKNSGGKGRKGGESAQLYLLEVRSQRVYLDGSS